MRIVAGTARGRRLVVPEGSTTRPTTDRVREALFNALFSLGRIEGHTYCDAFAGSGALGLEALSRGAAHCTFVERDRHALAAIEANVAALDFGDRATIRKGDGLAVVATTDPFDVLLADPPYDFDDWSALLDTTSASLVVAESGRPLDAHPGWQVVREKRYGSTVVTVLEPIPQVPQESL